ncbi:ATP-binding protein [Lactonifactor longoviformis]|uniref:Magnesium chelatase family protein n=1 Tax=Lactonifactor longoviformis DSM 17459 TaxID=1122155 RepID=A0A1M4U6R0_9CLOT|nr:YifB family Mg chelatase-like AAA ATPase [Lactonifactor longoviformis]POP33761.1 ATP-binding protein [Lactonifactor longoviformis]SHE52257.1 magnesium chelatase family protein [Lactonifactor longoviformis DSM 17459]
MFSSVLSAAIMGVECFPVRVEADVSDGLPMFNMVGYLTSQVREAQDRVKTAMRNMGIALPPKRVTINLSPGDLRKDGPAFDLPIAAAILTALGYLEEVMVKDVLIVGELSLDGSVHPVSGILAMVDKAKEMGCRACVLPKENWREGQIIQGIPVAGVSTLRETIEMLRSGDFERFQLENPVGEVFYREPEYSLDFDEIQGQEAVKRAAVVAAAGFHNFLMIGPPGAGKTMVARRLPTIMPQPSLEECIEISRIYSIAGLLPADSPLMAARPFRAPHHTLSPQALAGGGRIPRPGEITLAHRGILFLDELTEFSRVSLEILRQPLEDRQISIARAMGSFCFPANCMVVAAMNPCGCGYFPDMNRCTCRPGDISKYLRKISGPLLDRMDICVEAGAVEYQDIAVKRKKGPSSAELRKEITRVHKTQEERFRGTEIRFNSQIPGSELETYCPVEKQGRELLEKAYKKMNFSIRGYHRILKTARTIADLEGEEILLKSHISEAICYRKADKKYWKI